MSTTTAPGVLRRQPASEGTAIRVVVGDEVLDARLWDNAPARDLVARLPLTLSFRDLDDVEKFARLEVPLSMEGMPAGDDPDPGDIGWYAPSSDLVLYYGDVGYWNGIARIGAFDGSTDAIAEQPDGATIRIELAD